MTVFLQQFAPMHEGHGCRLRHRRHPQARGLYVEVCDFIQSSGQKPPELLSRELLVEVKKVVPLQGFARTLKLHARSFKLIRAHEFIRLGL